MIDECVDVGGRWLRDFLTRAVIAAEIWIVCTGSTFLLMIVAAPLAALARVCDFRHRLDDGCRQ